MSDWRLMHGSICDERKTGVGVVDGTMKALLVVLAAGMPGCSDGSGPGDTLATLQARDKIDPEVVSRMARGPVDVMILGSRQLMVPPHGYDRFVERHAGEDRRALRQRVIDDLRQIAEAEQPSIREAVGGVDLRAHWLVNALSGRLDSSQIRRVAELDQVGYIFASGPLAPDPGDPGPLASTLSPTDRPPFVREGRVVPWNLRGIGANRAWDLGATGEGVVVAVLDVGVNYNHADLRANIWINVDEIPGNGEDDDGNGWADDYHGFDFISMRAEVGNPSGSHHGTWVSGIIAGDGSGGTITGVAPRARLMPLRARGTEGVLIAYQYAIENGADVINMSFSIPGLGNTRAFWRLMSEHAAGAGLVQVSGAGNFRRTQPVPVQLRTPEDIPTVIAAGGVDSTGAPRPFSSMGPVEWGSVALYGEPDELIKPNVAGFAGPGYPLLSTTDFGYIDPNVNIGGNSFSGPHAAGTAALILSVDPSLPAWDVKRIMEATARDLGPSGRDNDTGSGLLNAAAAVEHVR